MSIAELFHHHDDEFLHFERIPLDKRHSTRRDLHGMILLSSLFPSDEPIVSSAAHDEFWYSIESEQIQKLTEEQVIELLRCGIAYDESTDSLHSYR